MHTKFSHILAFSFLAASNCTDMYCNFINYDSLHLAQLEDQILVPNTQVYMQIHAFLCRACMTVSHTQAPSQISPLSDAPNQPDMHPSKQICAVCLQYFFSILHKCLLEPNKRCVDAKHENQCRVLALLSQGACTASTRQVIHATCGCKLLQPLLYSCGRLNHLIWSRLGSCGSDPILCRYLTVRQSCRVIKGGWVGMCTTSRSVPFEPPHRTVKVWMWLMANT